MRGALRGIIPARKAAGPRWGTGTPYVARTAPRPSGLRRGPLRGDSFTAAAQPYAPQRGAPRNGGPAAANLRGNTLQWLGVYAGGVCRRDVPSAARALNKSLCPYISTPGR